MILPTNQLRIDSEPAICRPKQIAGWQEQVCLPEFHGESLLAKCDTGAILSTLHATTIQYERIAGKLFVTFSTLHNNGWPLAEQTFTALVQDQILVRSSNGSVQRRPIIRTTLQIGSLTTTADITLTNRGQMQFALLLGRDLLQQHFLIDSSQCFLL